MTLRSIEHTFGEPVAIRPDRLPSLETSTRRLRGFSASWSMAQDRPVALENVASIGHVEDFNVGWIVSGGIGYFATSLGSTAGAPAGEVAASKGWLMGGRNLLLVEGWLRGRREPGEWREAVGRAALTVYGRGALGQTVAAHLQVVSSTNPDSGDWLYLGGRDGLRGYVDHFVAGDRRATFSIEDRVVTSWRPLGVLQFGLVAYVDAGVIRRADTGRWSRTYANIGAGLRLGRLKSGRVSPLHLSLAMPIVRDPGVDRLLLVFGNSVTF
jgi:hypothetical protein